MRHTRATVSLSAITRNLELAQRLAPHSGIVAVIKANAYGHGAIEIAGHLQGKVPAFAVAFFDEAVQLRDAGIKQPILVLQGTTADADVAEAAARDFWLMLHNRHQVDRVLRSGTTRPVHAWIKADTGMHRLGLDLKDLDGVIDALAASPNVQPGMVLCSHLACADDPDNPMTGRQADELRAAGAKYKLPMSIANSAGIMAWPATHADWNRPGYMLYGNSPMISSAGDTTGLVPAMSMCSEIVTIKELSPGDGVGYGQKWIARKPSRLGTVSIGYADGYPRHAANGTPVLVNGQRVPLVGRVSMDMVSVDLSGLDRVEIGDPVELWGQSLSVNEVAECSGTLGYELLAGLSGRVPVTYLP